MILWKVLPRSDDPSWLRGHEYPGEQGGHVGWDRATASDFTFGLFRARVSFVVNGIEFGVDGQEQPLLDYCLMLDLACRELQGYRGAQVESATGSFRMYYIREPEGHRMASDLAGSAPPVPVADYHRAVAGLLDSSLGEVISVHPECE